MGIFSREPKPVATGDDSTEDEKAGQKLKFATASARFGPVGKKDETWEEKK
jgi:hypothetical protein